jgi:hypothetical protein
MTLQTPWSRLQILTPTLIMIPALTPTLILTLTPTVTPVQTLTPTVTPVLTLILTPMKSAPQAVASESAVPIRCASSHVDNVRKVKRAILTASA